MQSPLMSQSEVIAYLGIDNKKLKQLINDKKLRRGEYGNFARSEVEQVAAAMESAILGSMQEPQNGGRVKPHLAI